MKSDFPSTMIRMLCGLLVLATLSACASLVRPNFTQEVLEIRPGEYRLDPEHVYIHFKIEHLGLSTVVGRFNRSEASLDFNPNNMADMRLEGVIDMASLDMNNPALEKRLLGSDWFDVARYPETSFLTTEVVPTGGNNIAITGDFTLHGVTRSLTLDAVFKGGADNLLTGKYTLGFAATGSFLRSDYGVDAFGGLIADEVFVEIHAEFQRES